MDGDLHILCVCTHNRTRSVIGAVMLERYLGEAGIDATVDSAGFMSEGQRATHETVRRLGANGFDVDGHRSSLIVEAVAKSSDLIITAEQAHVIGIAGRMPELFPRTFTLPELVVRAEQAGSRRGRPVHDWLVEVAADRGDALDYLVAGDRGMIGEIADPTGHSRRAWAKTIDELDDLTHRLAALLA